MSRILVVEDNEDLRLILEELLGQAHEVRAAASGEVAVQLAAEFRPEAVLLDLQLPDIDGIATGLRIKQAVAGDVPILVLTALGEQADREAVLNSGCCDAFLAKPATFAAILAEVEQLLGGSRRVA